MFQHMTSDHHRPLARWMRLALIATLLGLPLTKSVSPAQAASGDRDPAFGAAGIVTTDIGAEYDAAYAVAVQTDGKIVAAGTGFAVVRYNPDGSPDTSFGVNGIATAVFSDTESSTAQDIVIQPDGKIVLVGSDVITQPGEITNTIAVIDRYTLVRYASDGSLDATFGDGSRVTNEFNGSSSRASAAALQPDGRLMVVGYKYGPNSFVGVLARYNPDGSPDVSFGSAGKIITDFFAETNDVIIQPDGKIVVVGSAQGNLIVARYNSGGTPDYTFGVGGRVTIRPEGSGGPRGPGLYGNALALQSDNKLIVSGNVCSLGAGNFICSGSLIRLTARGDLDPTFGGTTPVYFPGEASDIILQADGKPVALSVWDIWDNGESVVSVLSRFTTDGQPDPDFNTDGQVIDDALQGSAIALQPEGRFIVAGSTAGNFAVARYVGQSFHLTKTVNNSAPDPGQVITYTVRLTNWDVVTATNGLILDILPGGLIPAGPAILDLTGAGTPGAPPNIVSGLSLPAGQSITVTFPVSVSTGLHPGAVLTNIVTFTSAQLTIPVTASVVLTTAAPPVPQPDFALTAKNTPVTLTVLANDYDPNGETFSIATVGMPISGTAATDGLTVVYTPTLNFTGTEVFTYTVSDGRLAADGTITVLVAEEVRRTYLPVIWRP